MFELLSQAENVADVQTWLQIATSLGFTGLAWYLIIYALPAMQKRFDDHADRQMASFTAEVERGRLHNQAQVQTILDILQKQKQNL